MIKHTVIELIKGDRRSVYISVQKRPELLAPLHHKLRVKSVIYGCMVSTYCPGMDFTSSVEAGWRIVVDNRENYVHDVKIIKAYARKEKKDKRCMMCGQPTK